MSEGAVEMGLPEAAGSGSLLAGGGPVDGSRSVAEHGQAAVARKAKLQEALERLKLAF